MTDCEQPTKEEQNSGGARAGRPAPGNEAQPGLLARTLDFLKQKILHVNDSPQRVARGVAIAFGVAFAIAPLLGLHIWVALILAFVLRANKISMIAFMWLHNPVTMWPILYLNARVGGMVAQIWAEETGAGLGRLADFLRQWQQEGVINSIVQGDFWKRLFDVMLSVGIEVWLGGAILGTLTAAVSYFGTKQAVILYRRTRARRRQKRGIADTAA
ncbi:MAG TPA: DUF2062 domain-containing protein [Sedimentisphaerales bacterium]|nr:DUF2062 domain-containing protein [Sedimentisphaerales bacterium]